MSEKSESRLLHALLPLANTVDWLNQVQPVAVRLIPAEHTRALKQLESLGLIYLRNRTTCALQKERLIRILKRDIQVAPPSLKRSLMSAYQFIFIKDDLSIAESEGN